MIQKTLIFVWFLSFCYFVLIPSFPPQPPSAFGIIFYQSLTVVAAYLIFRRLRSPGSPGILGFIKSICLCFLLFLAVSQIFILIYASLTTGIAIN